MFEPVKPDKVTFQIYTIECEHLMDVLDHVIKRQLDSATYLLYERLWLRLQTSVTIAAENSVSMSDANLSLHTYSNFNGQGWATGFPSMLGSLSDGVYMKFISTIDVWVYDALRNNLERDMESAVYNLVMEYAADAKTT